MNVLSRSELKVLLGKESAPCVSVSIYMPTQKAGSGVQQNQIRLKNLIRDAEKRLIDTGLRRPEAIKLMAPALELPDNDLFWRHQSEGLAIFISQETFRSYHVPLDFKEQVVVADRFHIKPLLPIFSGDGRFYILALSQNEIRLLQCSHYGTREVDLKGVVPGSLAEVAKHNSVKRLQSYHYGAPGKGKEGIIFHGQDIQDTVKKDILRFFQQVDRGLQHQVLKEEDAPLVLAGVENIHPIYKQANTYRHLFEKGIAGSPDRLSSKELHERAWEIMQPFFEQSKVVAVNEYKQLAGSGHTSNDIQEIVANAYQGKIEVLFVALGLERWGTFNPDTGRVDLHEKAQACDVDLSDFAAAHTLIHQGTVYAVKPEKVPYSSAVAAVFRHERHQHEHAHQSRIT